MSKLIDLSLLFVVLLMMVVLMITAFGSVIRNLWHTLGVIWKRISTAMSQTHCLRIRAYWLVFRQTLVNLSQVFKVVVLESLPGRHPIAIVVNKKLSDDFLSVGGNVGNQFSNTRTFLWSKVKLHMTCNSDTKKASRLQISVKNIIQSVALTFETSRAAQPMEYPKYCGSYALGLVHCCQGREETRRGSRSRRILLPNSPSYDCSSHRWGDTRAACTILYWCTL